MGRLLIGRHCLAGPRIPSWRWPIEACPLPGTVSGSSSRLGLQGGPPPTPFPDCSPHPQPGPCCPARGSMEARAPGTQHRTRPKPAPHAEPSPEPSGAPAPSASLPSPGRELSNLVRSRTVRASTRGCVGPDRLEPRAAFRHSEPGLNGARGFPRVPGADARARWLCLVSARRGGWIRGPLGVSTLPHWLFTELRAVRTLREGASPRGTRGLRGWASEWVLGPRGAASGVSRQRVDPGQGAGSRGTGALVGVGAGWAAREVSRRMRVIIFCPVAGKVRS